MIDAQRLFEIYRKLADSFDAYLRIVVFRRKIKGFKRLEKAIEENAQIRKKTRLFP